MKTFLCFMVSGLWLMAALPISALILLPIGEIFNMSSKMEDPVLIVGFAIGHLISGYLWSRSLTRRAGLSANRRAYLAAGIGYAISIIGVEINGDIFERLGNLPFTNGATHLGFGVIFVTWTGLVTGLTAMALGIGLKNWRLAFKLLIVGFFTGATVFLVVAFLMDLIGFRVGVPRVDGIPSMPIVTALGIWLTALIGSGALGFILITGARENETAESYSLLEGHNSAIT